MSRQYPSFADLVIVGSGPVGAAFARAVRDQMPDASILMVEAGPRLTEPPGVNVRNLEPAERAVAQRLSEGPQHDRPGRGVPLLTARPGTYLASFVPAGASPQDDMPAGAMSTNVGGMGAHWTCAVPRPGDSEIIPIIDAQELEAAFKVAESYLGATTKAFTPSPASVLVFRRLQKIFGQDRARPIQPMPLACRPGDDGKPRWTGADVVLGDLATETDGRTGFTLLDRTLCQRVLFDDHRAVGVELRDLVVNEIASVSASAVVVAADALRTPQVLWASGVRLPALGRYLNDQPQIVGAVYLNGLDESQVDVRSNELDHRDFLSGVYWVPFSNEHPFHVQVMQMDASPIAIGHADPSEGRPVVGIGYFCAKHGEADNRVEMSDTEGDSFGMPAIRIHYRLDEKDHAAVAAAEASLRTVADQLGDFIPDGQPTLLPAGSSLHYQGTTRMGVTDDGSSVCDSRSTVWGFENLFVGGNGVIPTATACNPTLTSVALAVRAAGAVIEQIKAGRLAHAMNSSS